MTCLAVVLRVPRVIIPNNGFSNVASQALAAQPKILSPSEYEWPNNLSGDISPVQCHSHNDYWRRVPLFDALSVGCISVEADVWLQNGDLLVGHVPHVLHPNRTLQSLYINPLLEILRRQNVGRQTTDPISGVFTTSSQTSLYLLIDMKNKGEDIWPVLLQQLEPLRAQGYLTTFNGTDFIESAITVVGTGNTPFPLVQASQNRIVFYDAPIFALDDRFNSSNSAWASASFQRAVGKGSFGSLSAKQTATIRDQIQQANAKGLKARYWQTPNFPVAFRDHVWSLLVNEGVGLLNIDDLIAGSRRNWNWCHFLGVTVC